MNPLTRLALTLAAAFLSLPVAAAAPPKESPPANSTVAGRVTVDGQPGRGVAVALVPQGVPRPDRTEPGEKVRADGDGHFRFTGVAAGRYLLQPLAPAHVLDPVSDYSMPGKQISVEENEQVENIDLALRRGGVITGRVTDDEGRPVIGAPITVDYFDARGNRAFLYAVQERRFTSDDRGIYRLFGLPAGKYKVAVFSISASRSTRVYHPGTTDEGQAKFVEVTPGGVVENVNVKVSRPSQTFEVAGRVADESGQPVPNVRVEYFYTPLGGDTKPSARQHGMGVVDAHGEFRLKELPPGSYTITVQTDYGVERSWYGEPAQLELRDGSVTGLELKVRRGGSVSGTVVVEGTQDAAVIAQISKYQVVGYVSQPGKPARPQFVRVSAAGTFRLTGLEPGTARMQIGGEGTIKGLTHVRTEHNGKPVTEGVPVGPGEDVTGVVIVLAYGMGVIKGQIQVQGGALPEGTSLFVGCRRADDATPQQYPRYGGVVDARGRFVIENLPTGEYELTVERRQVSSTPPVRLPRVTQRVSVVSGAEVPVTLVINLAANN
jgi:protocatechuate 3,4-dioxygenase beta subunit